MLIPPRTENLLARKSSQGEVVEAAANLLAAHGVQATVTSRSPSMAAVVEAMEAWEAARESHTGGG